MEALDQVCEPCWVRLERLPDSFIGTVLVEMGSRRRTLLRRANSAQRTVFGPENFEGKREENRRMRALLTKVRRYRKIAMQVTQRSARRRGRARRFVRPTQESTAGVEEHDAKESHLFSAFINMLQTLVPGGTASHLLPESGQLLANTLVSLPNNVLLRLCELAARKPGWIRLNVYDVLIERLDSLVKTSLVYRAVNDSDYTEIIGTFNTSELRHICKESGISRRGSKQTMANSLLSHLNENFLNLSTPGKRSLLGTNEFVRLSEEVRQLIWRTAFLFSLPMRRHTTAWMDVNPVYTMLRRCRPLNNALKDIDFNGFFPIFRCSDDFIRWADACYLKLLTEKAIDRKKWKTIADVADDVIEKQLLQHDTNIRSHFNNLSPSHKQFSAECVQTEILSLIAESLVLSRTNNELARKILRQLISQTDFRSEKRCIWMYLLSASLEREAAYTNDAAATALSASKTGCGQCDVCETKLPLLCKRYLSKERALDPAMQNELSAFANRVTPFEPTRVTIELRHVSKGFPGLKRVYTTSKNGSRVYRSVEELVMDYFIEKGYTKGLDDEGKGILSLCNLAIWHETYSRNVPNMLLASWQKAPLDWGDPEFWANRKCSLEERLKTLSLMDPDQLAKHLDEQKICLGHELGTVDWNALNFDTKFLLRCLTVPLFTAICTRVFRGGRSARRGFPDLFLWNEKDNSCLFVEVKGPKDKLSAAQRSWLKYISECKGQAVVAEVKTQRNTSLHLENL